MRTDFQPGKQYFARPFLQSIIIFLLLFCAWIWNLRYSVRLAADDAFVYVRYAMHWVDNGELQWNLGVSGTDGFTSFAHQMLVAAAYWVFKGDPVSAAWYVSIASSSMCIALAYVCHICAHKNIHATSSLYLWSGGLGLALGAALSPQFGYWAHSLMDVGTVSVALFCASTSLAIVTSGRTNKGLMHGLIIGVLGLVRPEGFLVCAVLAVLLLVSALSKHFRAESRDAVGAHLKCAGAIVSILFLYALWHATRYGYLFPNPTYVKTAGLNRDAFVEGISYLWQGPNSGYTPVGLLYQNSDGSLSQLTRDQIREYINPNASVWPYHLAILCSLLLFAATLFPKLWISRPTSLWVRSFMLPALGFIGLALLSGGDPQFAGWRLLTPVLAILLYSIGAFWPYLRFGLMRGIMILALASVAVCVGQGFSRRPELCARLAFACGLTPVSLENYSWDTSNASIDRTVASAVRKAFPPETVLAESDFLRIGTHVPEFEILDLSGLVNAEIAHRPHKPMTNLFLPEFVVEKQPGVVFWGWDLVSDTNLAALSLCDPKVGGILSMWAAQMPQAPFDRICSEYRGASIALPGHKHFNFLVHKKTVPQMRSREKIEISLEFSERDPKGLEYSK